MTARKRFRWVCPQCGSGKLLGARPALKATGRFCWPCSEQAGVLVERSSPRLDAARSARRDRSVEKAKRKRAREKSQWCVEGVDLRVLLRRMWGVAQKVTNGLSPVTPTLVLRRSRWRAFGGMAYIHRHRIRLTVQSDGVGLANITETMLHEVAHFIAYNRDFMADPHGATFKGALMDLETAWKEE